MLIRILGKGVGKRLNEKDNTEKVKIPIVCDKERACDNCINTNNQFTVRQNELSK